MLRYCASGLMVTITRCGFDSRVSRSRRCRKGTPSFFSFCAEANHRQKISHEKRWNERQGEMWQLIATTGYENYWCDREQCNECEGDKPSMPHHNNKPNVTWTWRSRVRMRSKRSAAVGLWSWFHHDEMRNSSDKPKLLWGWEKETVKHKECQFEKTGNNNDWWGDEKQILNEEAEMYYAQLIYNVEKLKITPERARHVWMFKNKISWKQWTWKKTKNHKTCWRVWPTAQTGAAWLRCAPESDLRLWRPHAPTCSGCIGDEDMWMDWLIE